MKKLRNKKTGEIKSIEEIIRDAFLSNELDSLKSIDTNWEDVDGTHDTNIPLIKDERIRKAVIAWAKANSQQTRVTYHQLDETHSCINFIDFGGLIIEFNKTIDDLTSGRTYDFEELCGGEE